MELIECKPYNAKITIKGCWLRYRKAALLRRLGKTHTLEFMSLEKCLDCGKGREMKAEDIKKTEPVKEETMQCKRCGRTEEEVRILKKSSLCVNCASTVARCLKEGREIPPFKGSAPKKPSRKTSSTPTTTSRKDPSPSPGEMVLELDFRGFPELFERLREEAKREIRTPELQAVYYIKQALEVER